MVDIPDALKRYPQVPDFSGPTAFSIPEIKPVPNPFVENAKANSAREFHRRLLEWINTFDANLDEKHEVGIRLVSFGQTVVFHLEGLGYCNPSLISFRGKTDSGEPVELIQHVSQISVLLMKLPRKDLSKPKHPIGFHVGQEQPDVEHGTE